MADQATNESWGRKVFFLYPPKVIEEVLIHSILMSEYEVYMVKDHVRLLPVLREFGDSVLFINIDSEVKGLDWANYVKAIMSSSDTKEIRIAVVSSGDDKEIIRKYVIDLQVACGYIRIRTGVEESTRLLLKALKESQAMGKRKFVRAQCDGDARASFNIKYWGGYHTGVIRDISVAGMAGTFDTGVRLEPGTHLTDMQLKLKSRLARVSGQIVGRRSQPDGPDVYVILFGSDVPADTKVKLHAFIFETLQVEMDRKMASIPVQAAPPPQIPHEVVPGIEPEDSL